MGDVTSLIDTRNLTIFPQRLIFFGEELNIRTELIEVETTYFDYWGDSLYTEYIDTDIFASYNASIRYHVGENIAIQVNGDYADKKYVDFLNDCDGYFLSTAYNRVDAILSIRDGNRIFGLRLKFYSNSDDDKYGTTKRNHIIRYFSISPGLSMELATDSHFDIGAGIGFGTWDGEYMVDTENQYEFGIYEVDGWWNLNLNCRYYKVKNKIDFAPYFSFYYNSLGDKIPINNTITRKYTDSNRIIKFGTGIHYKPTTNVRVYNDIEFSYFKSELTEDNGEDIYNKETITEINMTVLPTYKTGVELIHELDQDNFFENIKLWGGFNKRFTEDSYSDDNGQYPEGNKYERIYPSTSNEFTVTYGAALVKGNYSIEFFGSTEAMFEFGIHYSFE